MKIRVLNSQTLGEVQELNLALATRVEGECIIGRSPNAGIVLDSPDVSRLHGKFLHQDGNFYFCDLGSRNGSIVNGELAPTNQKYKLKKGDVIRIGEFVLMTEEINLVPEDLPENVYKRFDAKVLSNWRESAKLKLSELGNQQKDAVNEVSERVFPGAKEISEPSSPEMKPVESETNTSKLTDFREINVFQSQQEAEIYELISRMSEIDEELAVELRHQNSELDEERAINELINQNYELTEEELLFSEIVDSIPDITEELSVEEFLSQTPEVDEERSFVEFSQTPQTTEEQNFSKIADQTSTNTEDFIVSEIISRMLEIDEDLAVEEIISQIPEASEDEKLAVAELINQIAGVPNIFQASNSQAVEALKRKKLVDTIAAAKKVKEDEIPKSTEIETPAAENDTQSAKLDDDEPPVSEVHETSKITSTKYIVLIAHDSQRLELAEFIAQYRKFFSRSLTLAPPSISNILDRQLGITISRQIPETTSEEYQTITSMIAAGEILAVIFLRDFMTPQPDQVNEEDMLRVCNINQVLIATNLLTAEAIVHYIQFLEKMA